jgi:hypothetical protein
MLARRTRLLVGASGIQEPISNQDGEQLRTARRSVGCRGPDVGARPVWQAALEQMVAELTGMKMAVPGPAAARSNPAEAAGVEGPGRTKAFAGRRPGAIRPGS